MATITIPIPARTETQRTLKIVGRGLKAFLTTKVSGKLVIRRKTPGSDLNRALSEFPPRPEANAEDTNGVPLIYCPKAEDLHDRLLCRGIKVRDFAYPASQVGHCRPIDPHLMAFVAETDMHGCEILSSVLCEKPACETKTGMEVDIPLTVEATPMPCVSTTWTEPHPSLRPLPKRERHIPVEIPTPDKPYCPVYETHRIPSWFDQPHAVAEVDYRLSENPRTVPIRGMTTRRLLTLSPDLVDLTRYDEMDLEELRRYDRFILRNLLNGIEPYPWRTMHVESWVPSPETRLKMHKDLAELLLARDAVIQRLELDSYADIKVVDDEWEAKQFYRCYINNTVRTALHPSQNQNQNLLSRFDKTDDSPVTLRQRLTLWERRMDTAKANADYASNLQALKEMRAYDAEQRGEVAASQADVEADTEMVDPVPFTPGIRYACDLPPFPVWGPKAPHSGAAYRRNTAPPTAKTLNDYLTELSSCSAAPNPTPLPLIDYFYTMLKYPQCLDEPFSFRNEQGRLLWSLEIQAELARLQAAGVLAKLIRDQDKTAQDADMGVPDADMESVDAGPSLPGRKRGIQEVESGLEEEPRPKRRRIFLDFST